MKSSESAAGRNRKAADEGPPSLGRLEDEVLSTAQVAQLLHVGTKTVINFVQNGTLTAHRLPGTRRFLFWRRDIIRLIEDNVVKPGEVETDDDQETVKTGE